MKAQNDLTDLGFDAHHPPELSPRHPHGLYRPRGTSADNGGLLAQEVQLTRELVRAVRGDDDISTIAIAFENIDGAV
jgi:hypothetical protein